MSLSGPARAWTQSNISVETWKCVSAPIQPDRAWEVRRRIADNYQMQMGKAYMCVCVCVRVCVVCVCVCVCVCVLAIQLAGLAL